jgi:SAM-dependent methyltransferase
MTAFKDHFSTHAPDYRTHRPLYPRELFAYLAGIAPARGLAWDCGTGNGQAAVGLAEHFERVIATDASAGQLAEAEPHPRVQYRVAPADRSTLADHSADLVTAAQALHWFPFDAFYTEVRRVTRLGGILAVWTYGFHRVNADVDRVLERFETGYVKPYWPPERQYVWDRYRTVPFPFPELTPPHFEMAAQWDLAGVLGYLRTWSATKRFVATHGFDPVERLADDFATAWGDPTTPRTIRWDLHLRVRRVQS